MLLCTAVAAPLLGRSLSRPLPALHGRIARGHRGGGYAAEHREHLFRIARDAYWPPTIDRDQTIRNLALAVIEELRMYEAQQSRRAN
jgi:hypothetical protein